MINLAVINLKTLIKKITKIISIVLILSMVVKFAQIIYYATRKLNSENFEIKNNISMIQNNLNVSYAFEEKKENKTSDLKKILVAQLAVFSGAEEKNMEQENQEEVTQFQDIEDSQAIQIPQEEQNEVQNTPIQEPENFATTVIETNNKKDVYTNTYNSVCIKNESKYSLTEEMLVPDIKFSNTQEVIVYHTHTCESYTPTENFNYVSTGNYRTTDLNYSVARVGTELTNFLTDKGYDAIHDTTYHDYPAYTGSYTRSLSTIQNLLSTHPTVDCIFDIHRDALREQ